jgi:hypothetical protein
MIPGVAGVAATAAGFTTPQAIITSGSGDIFSTLNGTTWTENTLTTPTSAVGATYFDNNWVIGGPNGTIYYAGDTLPASWTLATVGNSTGQKRDFVVSGSSALAVGNLVASGFDRYVAEQSTSVATWTLNTTSLSTTNGWSLLGAATNGSGTWAAVGDNNSAQLSYQTSLGGTWTTGTIGAICRGIAFGSSIWVAGGNSGALYSSPDLVTWTSRTSGFGTNQIRQICFGNSLFVAVGAAGNISTSTNGTTWTSRTSGTANALRDVRWCNPLGLWVACGDSSTILTSPDGITWTSRTAPTAGLGLARVAVKP